MSVPSLDMWREKRPRERNAGVGSLRKDGEVGWEERTVRGPHSTDNVTFFNPRFTLFAPPSDREKGPNS